MIIIHPNVNYYSVITKKKVATRLLFMTYEIVLKSYIKKSLLLIKITRINSNNSVF